MPPDPMLLEAKRRVESHFLGQYGIHGIGASHSKRAVRIYAEVPELLTSAIRKEIHKLAFPFAVIVIAEKRPNARS
jgi:hypothetical protein